MITRMDANGRVLLPLGIRYRLDLNEGDELAVEHLGDGTILLKKIIFQARSEGIVASEKDHSQRGAGPQRTKPDEVLLYYTQ